MAKKRDIEQEMEEMLHNLFEKFDKDFKKMFGNKCSSYHWNCIQCNVWDVYDRFKKDLSKDYMRK